MDAKTTAAFAGSAGFARRRKTLTLARHDDRSPAWLSKPALMQRSDPSRLLAALSALACLALSTGCARVDQLEAAERQVKDLEARVAALEAAASEDKKIGLDDLNWGLRLQIEANPLDSAATLSVGSSGYALAQTNHGPMALTFRDIKPLGAGSRVTVQIVSMAAVVLSDVELKISYNNFDAERLGEEGYTSKSKEATKELSEDLAPGVAKRIEIDLPDMKHDELRFMSISVYPGSMRYR